MRLLSAAILGLGLCGLTAAQGVEPYAGEITATGLNLRAGPGEAYQTVVKLERGDKVVVLGKHANNTAWIQVEVPGGYEAWVNAKLVKKGVDGIGEITARRVLVRPRPSTRYHQLSGRLNRGESVRITAEKRTPDEGLWCRVKVPRRIPLYASAQFVKNIGPASLAGNAAPRSRRQS